MATMKPDAANTAVQATAMPIEGVLESICQSPLKRTMWTLCERGRPSNEEELLSIFDCRTKRALNSNLAARENVLPRKRSKRAKQLRQRRLD